MIVAEYSPPGSGYVIVVFVAPGMVNILCSKGEGLGGTALSRTLERGARAFCDTALFAQKLRALTRPAITPRSRLVDHRRRGPPRLRYSRTSATFCVKYRVLSSSLRLTRCRAN